MNAKSLTCTVLTAVVLFWCAAFAQDPSVDPFDGGFANDKVVDISAATTQNDSLQIRQLDKRLKLDAPLEKERLKRLPVKPVSNPRDDKSAGGLRETVLYEDFESCDAWYFPPDGWSLYNYNSEYTWETGDEYPWAGSFYATCRPDPYGNFQNEWLVSPTISLAEQNYPVKLSFLVGGRGPGSDPYEISNLYIVAYLWDYDEYYLVWDSWWGDFIPYDQWRWSEWDMVADLTGLIGAGDISLIFIYLSDNSVYPADWAVDNINVYYEMPPECEVSTTEIVFGTTDIGDSTGQTFQIANRGTEVLAGTIDIQGANPEDFYVVPGSYSLAGGDSAVFTVWFRPLTYRDKTCTINLGNVKCNEIYCTGITTLYTECSVSASELDFGSVQIGNDATLSFSIINTGTDILEGNVTEECDGFAILEGGGAFTLGADESWPVTVEFAPDAVGQYSCIVDLGDICADVTCSGLGYEQTSLAIADTVLYLNADSIEEIDCEPDLDAVCYVVSGNVNINEALYFPDGDTVIMWSDDSTTITGEGQMYVPTEVVGDWLLGYAQDFRIAVDSTNEIKFSDPNNISFFLFYLVATIDKMFIIDTEDEHGISLNANLQLISILAKGFGGSLKLAGLPITKEHGMGIPDEGFEFSQKFDIDMKCMKLTGAKIGYYDSLGGMWMGGVTVKWRDKFTLGTELEFVDGFHLNRIYANYVFGKEIPIGTTGMSLAELEGEVAHFADADPQPWSLGIWARIVGGKKFPVGSTNYYIFSLDNVGGKITFGPSMEFELGGQLKFLNELLIGEAAVTYKDKSLFYESNMQLLGFDPLDIYRGWMNLHISGDGVYGSCGGKITTPSSLPFWLNWAEKKTIAYSSAEARFDDDYKYVRGKASIKVCIKLWFGKKCKTYDLAYRFRPKSSWPFMRFALGTNYGNLQELKKTNDGDKLAATYVIPEQTDNVMFFVRQEIPDWPAWYLVNPEGDTIDTEHIQPTDDILFVDSLSGEIDPDEDSMTVVYYSFYSVDNPSTGQWDVVVPGATDPSCEISIRSSNQAPSMQLLRPAVPKDDNLIEWEAHDFDDNASIRFFFDDDNSGFDGLPINAADIEEDSRISSITWDYDGVDPGEYYIYAIIDDSSNSPVRLYSQGTIEVEGEPNSIPAPTILEGSIVDSTVMLTWTPVSGFSQYVVMYRKTLDTEEPFVTGAAVPDTTALIYNLVPGNTYEFKAAAASSDGEIGEMSEGYVIELIDESGNNSPVITSLNPPRTAVVGKLYEYQLTVEDIDGDFDAFEFKNAPPENMSVTGGLIRWTPNDEQTGVSFIDIQAIDAAGNSDQLSYKLTVFDSATVNTVDVRFNSNTYRGLESNAYITVDYLSSDLSEDNIDTLPATIYSTTEFSGIPINCVETAKNSNEFTASVGFTTGSSQMSPPKIRVQSSDQLTVSVHPEGNDEPGIDVAIWYNCPDSCNMFDMQMVPNEWSVNWVPSHAAPDPVIPPVQVILSEQESLPWKVGSIATSSIRLNGLIAHAKEVPVVIDSSLGSDRMMIEFDAFLALYSMGSVTAGESYPVTISGTFRSGEVFCATGKITINDDPIMSYLCGDANNDDQVNVGDVVSLINYIFKDGSPLPYKDKGDANCDRTIDVGDAVYLINYIFKGGPEPCCP